MDFHFIRYLWNELCVFISPSLWRGDIKHTTSFINTLWNENSFQILFITCFTSKNVRKLQIYRVFLPILLRKTRQRRGVVYDVIDELRRLGLSKSCSALCHKLIYDIAIFHSINGESCDKIIYLSLDLLIWMNVMLDFIWTGFAELWGTGRERKMQDENIRLQWDSSPKIRFEPTPDTALETLYSARPPDWDV